MPIKINKNQGIYFNDNYSYLAIQLEQSASFASLIRLYDNSKITFVFALMKCSNAAFGEQNKMKLKTKIMKNYTQNCPTKKIIISATSVNRYVSKNKLLEKSSSLLVVLRGIEPRFTA